MGKVDTKYGKIDKKETSAAIHIPYTSHVNPYTITTENEDYIQVIKLQGISFETVDTAMLNIMHEQRNTLFKSKTKNQFALWVTQHRKKAMVYPEGEYESTFAKEMNERYKENLKDRVLYRNDLYMAVIHRNVNDLKAITKGKKLIKKLIPTESGDVQKKIKNLTDDVKQIEKSLHEYEPKRLRTYIHNDIVYSEIYEYLSLILNGQHQRVPLTRSNIKDMIVTTRLSFGSEAGEIRTATSKKYFAALGIKDYYAKTFPGMLDNLLKIPVEYVLTQSFEFENTQKVLEQVQLQHDRLISSGDLSESQIYELNDAMDDLASGRVTGGYHNLSLIVYADSLKELDDNIPEAKTAMENSGIVIIREDLSLEPHFWSQLPGNFSYRPRPSLITTKNFSGFCPLHNFPTGYLDGNHWGPAVALLPTTSNTSYYFNFHMREKGQPSGNGALVGPNGTGKTVFMGFMFALSEKYNCKRVFFDKDQGAGIMINSVGGLYTVFEKGKKTGFQPLQLDPIPKNIAFMSSLFKRIAVLTGGEITSNDEVELNSAIQGLIKLPLHKRTITNLLSFLNTTIDDGMYSRLSRWAQGEEYGWVFDNDEDSLNLNNKTIGFDMTDVLDDAILRTPLAMYIIHRIRELIKDKDEEGNKTDKKERITITFDEGWKYAADEVLGGEIENLVRTIRKQEGIVIFGTNDPGDIAKTGNSKSDNTKSTGQVILSQSMWQVYFPNPRATREDYIEGFGFTEKEFKIITELKTQSRKILIKRGQNSVVVKLDLAGMDNDIAVLSGTTKNVQILNRVIDEKGNNPEDFLPIFHERRKAS